MYKVDCEDKCRCFDVYQDPEDWNDIYTIYTQYRKNVVDHWHLNKI